MAEWELENQEIIDGHKEFYKFIASDFNKNMLIKTIDNCINSSEWPEKYFLLRDEYIPGIMGVLPSKYLFWSIMTTADQRVNAPIKINNEEEQFINYLYLNYTKIFYRAKLYNVDPLGFYEVRYTHSGDRDKVNTFVYRNDGKKIQFRSDATNIMHMIEEHLYYFTEVIINDAINIDNNKEMLLHDIQEMRSSLSKIEYKIKSGDNINE